MSKKIRILKGYGAKKTSLKIRHEIFCVGHDGLPPLMECPVPGTPGAPHDPFDRPTGTSFYAAICGAQGLATARVIRGPDTPVSEVYRKLGLSPPVPFDEVEEPSKYGVNPDIEDKRLSREGFLRLVGATLVDAQCKWWVIAALPGLAYSLSWMPWEIHATINWPAPAGGPQQLSPVFLLHLPIWEVGPATKILKPELYDLMFPNGEPQVGGGRVRPEEELAELRAHNLHRLKVDLAAWKADTLNAPRVPA
ncbi:MAG: hypothetical protein JWN01_555 [Patescibacteria group bacterium]|nr:hypothetical protein [Patescibacteria group bacterium]